MKHDDHLQHFDPRCNERHSPRMRGYDYSHAAAYFVTVCCHERKCLLGHIAADGLHLSASGVEVQAVLRELVERFPGVYVVCSVVMPNHFHCLLHIESDGSVSLSKVVGWLKYVTTRRCNLPHALWQRSFHDHIVRDAREYSLISNYIAENPVRWQADCFYTEVR